MTIIVYKIGHTIIKTSDGGVKGDLAKDKYQKFLYISHYLKKLLNITIRQLAILILKPLAAPPGGLKLEIDILYHF